MWGQAGITFPLSSLQRIIPTRVGTRSEKHFLTPKATDHPHACGDKFSFLRTDNLRQGSSPRVWGQAHNALADVHHGLIIPTRVGTSRFYRVMSGFVRDHPHACGDKK